MKDIKEQDVYMGDMPLMTPNGTFIVNGTERVIVIPDAPLARASSSTTTRARPIPRASCCSPAAIIPYRGSWLDFEFDAKDIVFARIDRRRKLPVTTLLYALGMDQDAIMAPITTPSTFR